MFVSEHGPTEAPTTVLLHGGGVGGWSWQPQVEVLSASAHLLVPDLPGHGQSPGPFSLVSAAEAVGELIRTRANGGRARVVGLSLGAQVATQLLALAPELVERAFLSGTLTRPVAGLGSALGRALTRATLASYLPFRNWTPLVRANMRALDVPPAFEARFREDTRALTLDGLTRVTTENLAFRVPAGLSSVTAPVLVVVGERERKVMHASARDLVAALPNARGVVVKGVGHNWSLEAPGRFNSLLRAFLDGDVFANEALPEGLVSL